MKYLCINCVFWVTPKDASLNVDPTRNERNKRMITIDELKVQLADYAKAVKDLEEALAIEASRKRVQELEHTMSRPGFYDDTDLSKKVFDEVGDLKGKLSRFEKLQACTMTPRP